MFKTILYRLIIRPRKMPPDDENEKAKWEAEKMAAMNARAEKNYKKWRIRKDPGYAAHVKKLRIITAVEALVRTAYFIGTILIGLSVAGCAWRILDLCFGK